MPPLIRRKAARRPAAPEDGQTLLKRGSEHLRRAAAAFETGEWQAAATASMHAVRATAEALLATRIGIRTATEGTGELAYLLLRHLPDPGVWEQVELLIRMSDLQREARLEPRPITEEEAARSLRNARQFVEWGSSALHL